MRDAYGQSFPDPAPLHPGYVLLQMVRCIKADNAAAHIGGISTNVVVAERIDNRLPIYVDAIVVQGCC